MTIDIFSLDRTGSFCRARRLNKKGKRNYDVGLEK